MSSKESHAGHTPGGEPTTSLGHRTSGEAGSTPTHETMAETGGSGGPGLTRNTGLSRQNDEERFRQPAGDSAMNARAQPGGVPADPRRGAPGTDVKDSGARGYQDTRSRQAGPSETGLGTPETGANQTEADLDRQRGTDK